MRRRKNLGWVAGVLSTLFLLLADAVLPGDSAGSVAVPRRVLLIGNSLSEGLNTHLKGLAASASPPMDITVDTSITEATSLGSMWSLPDKHERILRGSYDRVVLQGGLSETGTAGRIKSDTELTFPETARKFDREIRQSGARTLLLMHWQFEEPGAMSIERIARIHGDVAAELGAEVAPVGLAFQRARKQQPDLQLLIDGVHASFIGEYLATCVLYAALFKKSPVGLPYLGIEAMTSELAAFLQRVAWETWQDYRQPSLRE